MTPFLGLLLILAIALVGSRFFSRSTLLKTPLFSGFIVSGIPYILIGILLGPKFFNFLNEQITDNLEPLVSLSLGWVGILFGIQLRWRNLKRFPKNYLLFSSLQSLLSLVIIFVLLLTAFIYLSPVEFSHRWEAAIILASIGSITAPISIAKIVIENRAKGRLTHFLQFVSSLDAIWGITIAGIVMALFHPSAVKWLSSGWQWMFLSLVFSIILGLLFRFLIKFRFQSQELLLLVLGLVIFTSGIGFYLRLSPILMNMVVGITLAQFPRESEKVMRVLPQAEKPIYLFLLVMAGALWNYHFLLEILLIISFLIARFVGKYLGGWAGSKWLNCSFPVPSSVGKGLLSFGGISLALAFNFQLFYGGASGDLIMSATIVGIFIFDEYTALSTMKMLRQQGEVR